MRARSSARRPGAAGRARPGPGRCEPCARALLGRDHPHGWRGMASRSSRRFRRLTSVGRGRWLGTNSWAGPPAVDGCVWRDMNNRYSCTANGRARPIVTGSQRHAGVVPDHHRRARRHDHGRGDRHMESVRSAMPDFPDYDPAFAEVALGYREAGVYRLPRDRDDRDRAGPDALRPGGAAQVVEPGRHPARGRRVRPRRPVLGAVCYRSSPRGRGRRPPSSSSTCWPRCGRARSRPRPRSCP